MKSVSELATEMGEELKVFDETKKTDAEVISFRLEGEDAIYFRGLLRAVDKEGKKDAIYKIVKGGLLFQLKHFNDCLMANMLFGLDKNHNG